MFFLLAFIIFLAAYLGAGYYVWRVPEQEAEQMLSHRLRELRASVRARAQAPSGLIRTEQRGTFAFLGISSSGWGCCAACRNTSRKPT